MSQFTTPLKVQANNDGTWTLLEEFEYYMDDDPTKDIIKIDAGFITDFASVPRIFWNIYPPYDPHYGKAAVIHDGLYAAKIFKRSKSDKILKEAMKVLGASWITRHIIWLAVRVGGGHAWETDKFSMLIHYINGDLIK
jgi:hypothetical protein